VKSNKCDEIYHDISLYITPFLHLAIPFVWFQEVALFTGFTVNVLHKLINNGTVNTEQLYLSINRANSALTVLSVNLEEPVAAIQMIDLYNI
jgi:hypothetical protein